MTVNGAGDEQKCAAARHGTTNAYTHYGCRCDTAKAAMQVVRRRYSARLRVEGKLTIDATGTRRRIQALRRLGWSKRELAHRLEWWPGQVDYVLAATGVHVDTAGRVREVYGELSMTVPRADGRAARYAEAQGWPPPLAWDDDTIDDPAALPWTEDAEGRDPLLLDDVAISRRLGGDERVWLSAAEKREALRRGLARGMTENELMRLLKLSWQTAGLAKAGVLVGGRKAS